MIPKDSTPVKHKILTEIFAKRLLTLDEIAIVSYIMRWSWGFDGKEGRRQDWTRKLKKRQIAEDIRLGESKVGRILNIMIKENKIIVKDKCYQFNEHYESWEINNTKCGISKILKNKILERDNYTCQYCGKSNWKDEVKLEIDHIIPISKGGTDDINNLQTLCKKCNRKKMNKILKVDEKTSSNNDKKVDEKTSLTVRKDNLKLTKRQLKVDEKTTLGMPNNQGEGIKNKDVRGGEHTYKDTLKDNKNKKDKNIRFNFIKKEFTNLTKERMEEFDEKYPGVDIDQQIERMENWLMDEKEKRNNGEKDKIPKDYNRFINNWLKKEEQQ